MPRAKDWLTPREGTERQLSSEVTPLETVFKDFESTEMDRGVYGRAEELHRGKNKADDLKQMHQSTNRRREINYVGGKNTDKN